MKCKCRRPLGFADVGNWDRFREFSDDTWDYVIEAGMGDPTKEEEEAILRLGYYGKAITSESVTRIAQGLPWKPSGKARYTITAHCVDGSSEEYFMTLEDAGKYVRERLGADARNVTPDGFGTDYCNYAFDGFTMTDIEVDVTRFW